jgi:peptidoglycan/xylan/chitin deacetylase (PgdA/CDA1 family)
MKGTVKKYAGMAFSGGAIFDMVRSVNKRKLLILYYHRVVKDNEVEGLWDRNMCVELERFDEQMKFLSERYVPMGEEDIIGCIEDRSNLPEHSVWVTFDDGYKDNYTNAFPVLEKYGIPATFFVTTGYVNKETICVEDYIPYAVAKTSRKELRLPAGGRELVLPLDSGEARSRAVATLWRLVERGGMSLDERHETLVAGLDVPAEDACGVFLDWPDLMEMREAGQSVGAHTVKHIALSSMPDEDILDVMTASKHEIEERLGISVRTFAYPNGKRKDFNLAACAPILKSCGFSLGVTTIGGHNDISDTDGLYNLRRVGISYEDTLGIYKFKIGAGGFWQS